MHKAILKEEETMSDADNKAISNVTVARQPLSLSMCRLNKEAEPGRLLILITKDNHTHVEMWRRRDK